MGGRTATRGLTGPGGGGGLSLTAEQGLVCGRVEELGPKAALGQVMVADEANADDDYQNAEGDSGNSNSALPDRLLTASSPRTALLPVGSMTHVMVRCRTRKERHALNNGCLFSSRCVQPRILYIYYNYIFFLFIFLYNLFHM